MRKATDKIETCRRIISNHQVGLVDNQWVDTLTANAIVTVYDALNKENQIKFSNFNVPRMADIAWKLLAPKEAI